MESKGITANQAREFVDSAVYSVSKVLNGINSKIEVQARSGSKSLTTMYKKEIVSEEMAQEVISDLEARGFTVQHKLKDEIHTFAILWM